MDEPSEIQLLATPPLTDPQRAHLDAADASLGFENAIVAITPGQSTQVMRD
jgi:hypothetical protein